MLPRLGWPRYVFWAWAVAVGLVIASGAMWSVEHGSGDWRVFVSAGARAGTHALIEPREAWQIFLYLPAAAWACVPFARLPPAFSFGLDAVLMLGFAAAAGSIAARTYGLPRATACGLFVLWPPVVYSACIIGQNAPLGLLLAQLTIAGITKGSPLLAAVPLGMLLYKPTYALPLIALLVLIGRLRELALVAACGAAWYVTSVAATGGDWGWPAEWARMIARYAPGDLSVNGAFVVGLPGLLARAGAPLLVVATLTAVAAAIVVLALRRAAPLEAATAACLAGVALSPHALAYDAALAAPMIAWGAARLTEPDRTHLLLALYVAAPLFFISPLLGFDPLAVVVLGGTAVWVSYRLRTVA